MVQVEVTRKDISTMIVGSRLLNQKKAEIKTVFDMLIRPHNRLLIESCGETRHNLVMIQLVGLGSKHLYWLVAGMSTDRMFFKLERGGQLGENIVPEELHHTYVEPIWGALPELLSKLLELCPELWREWQFWMNVGEEEEPVPAV